MIRGALLSLTFFIGMGVQAGADEKPALEPGNYIVYYAFNASSPEQAFALIKVEKKGGKLIGALEDSAPQLNSDLKEFSVDGRKVFVAFDLNGRQLSFEGMVSEKNPKLAVGSFGDAGLTSRGKLSPTENTKLEKSDLEVPVKLPEGLTKANSLNAKVAAARNKLRRAKGDDDTAAAKMALEAAEKELAEQAPALLKEVLEKSAESPAIIDTVAGLLGLAEKSGAKPEDVAKWLKIAETFAQTHGERFTMNALIQCGTALASQKGFENTAIEILEKASKLLTANSSFETETRILRAVQSAQEKAGKTEQAKQTDARIDKLYLAKIPPFKPTKFPGRKKEGATRVAVLELFTGAYCPPCVAADVAFDALLKSYKPTELVMIQYHMHIPASDPLTNPDTEARWKYYPGLGGVPSSLFNGKKLGGGGGGMANSEAKFKGYRGFIDPILDEETPLKLGGSVVVKGDKLAISIDVDGLKDSDKDLKLRIVVVEEAVKYVGGNGIRFHHHVARAFAGGADGISLDKNGAKTADVDLVDVRKKLKSYLEDFVKDRGEFGNPDKPLALKDLRVIAFVQDDNSKAILQAIQLDVPEVK